MAGRSLTAARAATEAERITKARELPTKPREQPATYTDEIIPELLSLADLGMTDAEIAAHWNVTEQELKGWGEAYPAFKAAVARAHTRAKAWWERSARLAMAERDTRYPAGLFSHVMRARYTEYDDKAQLSVVLDLAALVHVIRGEPDLPNQQRVAGPKPLIEGTAVRLEAGPTGEQQAVDSSCEHRPAGATIDGGGPPDAT